MTRLEDLLVEALDEHARTHGDPASPMVALSSLDVGDWKITTSRRHDGRFDYYLSAPPGWLPPSAEARSGWMLNTTREPNHYWCSAGAPSINPNVRAHMMRADDPGNTRERALIAGLVKLLETVALQHVQVPERDHWGEDPVHAVETWISEVQAGDTRLGYWEWVDNRDPLDNVIEDEQ